jgi:hypothetical protein
MVKSYKPTLVALLPDDWFAKESITLLSEDGAANVIASTEFIDPQWDSKQYADVYAQQLVDQFPGYRELSYGPFTCLGNRPGYTRQFEWMSDKGLVMQRQLYFAEKGTGWVVTATTTSTSYREMQSQLIQVLDGISIRTE